MQSDYGLIKRSDVKIGPSDTPSLALARKFAAWLRDRSLLIGRPNLKDWANKIEKLGYKYNPELVTETIEWYMASYGRVKTPRFFSIPSLTHGFTHLLDAKANDPHSIKLPDSLKHLLDEAKQLPWPNGVVEYLPLIIYRSYENYQALIVRGAEAAKKIAQNPELRFEYKLLRYLDDHYFYSPAVFIMAWLRSISDEVCNFNTWRGRVESLVWSLDNERFLRMARKWTDDYCGDYRRWNTLLEYLK